MAAFSTAANAFAVIGVADIVFRATTELYDRASRLPNAAQHIGAYLCELRQLAEVIARTRSFASDFASSPSAVDDGRSLESFGSALKDCQASLDRMRGFIDDVAPAAQDGWLQQWMKNARWVWSDQKLQQMCSELERHKTTLLLAISLVGRQDNLVLRQQHKETRNDIATFHAASDLRFRAVEHEIAASSEMSTQQIQNAATAIQISDQNHQNSLERVLASGNAIRDDVQRIDNQLNSFHAGIAFQHGLGFTRLTRATKRTERSLRNIESQLAQSIQDQVISISSLDSRLRQVTARFDDVIATENTRYSVADHGLDLKNVLVALVLAKSSFDVASSTIYKSQAVPESLVKFLQVEMRECLTHCRKVAAATGMQCPNTRTSLRIANEILSRNHNPTMSVSRDRKQGLAQFPHRQARRQYQVILDLHSDSINTTGKLSLALYRRRPISHGQTTSGYIVELTFLPHSHISECGITITSAVAQLNMSTPPISRWLRPFCISISSSDAVHYASTGDIPALQSLFKSGKASPCDRDENGNTILTHAAVRYQADMYKFLIHEGADPHDYTSQLSGLALAFHNTLDAYPPCQWDAGYSPRISTSLPRHERVMICTSMARTTLQRIPELADLGIQEMILDLHFKPYQTQFIESLVTMGYDLESRDYFAEATLWLHTIGTVSSRGMSCDLIRLIADRGADVHASSRLGWGALTWFFLSFHEWEEYGISAVSENMKGEVIWTISGENASQILPRNSCGEEGLDGGDWSDESSTATSADLGEDCRDAGYETDSTSADYPPSDNWDIQLPSGYANEYAEACDPRPKSQVYHWEVERENRMKNRLRTLRLLLERRVDPNEGHKGLVICDYMIQNDVAWWIWVSVLADVGYELKQRGDDSGAYLVVEAAQPYKGPSALEKNFLFTYSNVGTRPSRLFSL